MNVPDTLGVPDQPLTNFAALRAQAVTRLWEDPLAEWTRPEILALNELFGVHAERWVDAHHPPRNDWRACEGLLIVSRDLEDGLYFPKWAALAMWLAPESAVGSAPAFMDDLARLVLSGRLADYPHLV